MSAELRYKESDLERAVSKVGRQATFPSLGISDKSVIINPHCTFKGVANYIPPDRTGNRALHDYDHPVIQPSYSVDASQAATDEDILQTFHEGTTKLPKAMHALESRDLYQRSMTTTNRRLSINVSFEPVLVEDTDDIAKTVSHMVDAYRTAIGMTTP